MNNLIYTDRMALGRINRVLATLGALIGMGSTTAKKAATIAKGHPLARKYARPSNPAEVRTRYAGPWGTASVDRYAQRRREGQCLALRLSTSPAIIGGSRGGGKSASLDTKLRSLKSRLFFKLLGSAR